MPFRVGSKLPLPIYADVRYINDVITFLHRYVFDPYSGKTIAGPQATGGRTGAMTISEDGTLVATGRVDGTVAVFKYQPPAAQMQVPLHLQAPVIDRMVSYETALQNGSAGGGAGAGAGAGVAAAAAAPRARRALPQNPAPWQTQQQKQAASPETIRPTMASKQAEFDVKLALAADGTYGIAFGRGANGRTAITSVSGASSKTPAVGDEVLAVGNSPVSSVAETMAAVQAAGSSGLAIKLKRTFNRPVSKSVAESTGQDDSET